MAILEGIFAGVVDSIKGMRVIFYFDWKEKPVQVADNKEEPSVIEGLENVRNQSRRKPPPKEPDGQNVVKKVFQCCALNGGIFFLSIAFFDGILLPTLKSTWARMYSNPEASAQVWRYINPTLIGIFSLLWIMPLFLLSRIVNALWFADIADSAFKIRKGRPQMMNGISKVVADVLVSLVVQALFIAQSWIVTFIPVNYVGKVLSVVHMCLLYALYSFEYKWFNMGWELHKRLTYIEYNWPYFLGFGLPLALLTELPNSFILSGCVFSTLFPLFILSGNEAVPRLHSCDIPLKIFHPVIFISNAIFNKSIATPYRAPPQQQQQSFTPQSTPSSTPRGTPVPSGMRSSSSSSSQQQQQQRLHQHRSKRSPM